MYSSHAHVYAFTSCISRAYSLTVWDCWNVTYDGMQYGRTALHIATWNRNKEAVITLLDAGARANIKTLNGRYAHAETEIRKFRKC